MSVLSLFLSPPPFPPPLPPALTRGVGVYLGLARSLLCLTLLFPEERGYLCSLPWVKEEAPGVKGDWWVGRVT